MHRAGRWIAALAVAAVALSAGSAFAHKVKIFATAEGRALSGYVYFPGGGRAQGVTVQMLGPDGTRLAETMTNAEGEFTFEVKRRCDHTLVVETGDGHRATFPVGAAELPPDLPALDAGPTTARSPATAAEAAPRPAPATAAPASRDIEALVDRTVARHVKPLREQIERYEERRRLHDIIGGIGYIVGVAGIAFYLLGARRRAKPPTAD